MFFRLWSWIACCGAALYRAAPGFCFAAETAAMYPSARMAGFCSAAEKIAPPASGRVAVIAALSTPDTLAAKAATTSIPIAFLTAVDPVEAGFITSLNRPSGNLTGVTSLSVKLAPKKLQLLHELVPAATNMALLVNSINPNAETQSTELQRAAFPRAAAACLD